MDFKELKKKTYHALTEISELAALGRESASEEGDKTARDAFREILRRADNCLSCIDKKEDEDDNR